MTIVILILLYPLCWLTADAEANEVRHYATVFHHAFSFGFEPPPNVRSYEPSVFPEQEGWVRYPFHDPERWIEDGTLFQHPRLCDGCPGPAGEREVYQGGLGDWAGSDNFFIETRIGTDGPQASIPGGGPMGFSVGNFFGVSYHFTVARDLVYFTAGPTQPELEVEIAPDYAHVFRVEQIGTDLYAWMIDGELIWAGVPVGPFPTDDAFVNFAASYYGSEHIAYWDYLRFGVIPLSGTGDFDTDADIDLYDFFLFTEYTGGPGVPHAVGWSCGDMEPAEGDGDIDLADFAAFQNIFTGGE